MKRYSLINNLTGWAVFLIAAIVYLMTIEPTASFWDCGEFIASAFKLEVGHPPGAPFFMILSNFFTHFAGSDKTMVPVFVNSMSALASAFTILFLFWTITHLARKIIGKKTELTTGQLVAIMGSGAVGALAYTFSDTFWFSAVEGEVYATSSLFTALVFWAILKWENTSGTKRANRWLILIAYLMGLSIGVHLLNLLAIPAIVFVYYFKHYQVTRSRSFIALLVAGALLGIIMYGFIPGVLKIASWFDLLFVNVFGLPYSSGVLFYVVLLLAAIIWGLKRTWEKKQVLANTLLLAFTVMLIGYSSYAMTVIRSAAEPPMDQNDPDDLFSLLSYLNREQYGDRPLVFGQYYNAPVKSVEEGKPTYSQIDGKYKITTRKTIYKYDPRFITFFPRMYSPDQQHIQAYKEWGKIKGTPVKITNNQGKTETVNKPTFGENLRFFVRYQVGFMYLRYFMWNFAGRQNDIQGNGEVNHGNWISGIPLIDDARLGPQDELPDVLKNNRGRNRYFLLPLLLGIAGLLFHYKKQRKDFVVVMLLFIMTGFAIVVYLNQYPFQPRERDYAYAGSFYAFAVWIGLGVLALVDIISRQKKTVFTGGITSLICLIAVPGIMASENWDDHDRSGRYTSHDLAYDYLNSCAPDAILFTNGDNDTFPLWYIQEVEGVRTDVRVINLSYLGADWYISQMQRKAYDADPAPFDLPESKYRQGTRDIAYLIDRIKGPVDLKQAMQFYFSDNPQTKRLPNYREKVDYIPTKTFMLPVDSSLIMQTKTIRPGLANEMTDTMQWTINKNYIAKNEIMVLQLLANNNWKRPVYYAITVSRDNYMDLDKYFQIQGLAYRIVPIKADNSDGQTGSIDTKIMYDNMINKFKWGNIQDPKVYLDENNLRMLTNFRNNFSRLAESLINEGKKDSARIVLDECLRLMPNDRVPYNFFNLSMIQSYYRLNETEKANDMAKTLAFVTNDELRYFISLDPEVASTFDYETRLDIHILQEIIRLTGEYGQTDLRNDLNEEFQNKVMMLTSKNQR